MKKQNEMNERQLKKVLGGRGPKVSVAGTTDVDEARRRIKAYLSAMSGPR